MEIKNLINLTQDPFGEHYLFMRETLVTQGLTFQIPIKMSLTEGLQLKVNSRLIKLKSITSLVYHGPLGKNLDPIRGLKFPLYEQDLIEVVIKMGSTIIKKRDYVEKISFKKKDLDKCLDEIAKIKHINVFVKILEVGPVREQAESRYSIENPEDQNLQNDYYRKLSFGVKYKDPDLIKTVFSYLAPGVEIPNDLIEQSDFYFKEAFKKRNNLLIWQMGLDSLNWYSKKTTVDQIKKYQTQVENYISTVQTAIKNNSIIVFQNST